MTFANIGTFSQGFKNNLKSLFFKNEIASNNLDIEENFEGKIIINYDNFLYHDSIQEIGGHNFNDNGDLHGKQMRDLQKILLEKSSKDYKIINFETQSPVFSTSKKAGLYNSFILTQEEISSKTKVYKDSQILNIFKFSKHLREKYPKAKIDLNISLNAPNFSKNDTKYFFDLAKNGVNINVSAGNNNLSMMSNSIGVLYQQLKDRGFENFTYEHYLKIYERRLDSLTETQKGDYNFDNLNFSKGELNKKLEHLKNGDFSEKSLKNLKEHIENQFNIFMKTKYNNEVNEAHKIGYVLSEEYDKLPRHEQLEIKKHLTIVEGMDYFDNGLNFTINNNELMKIRSSNPELYNEVLNKFREFNKIRNDRTKNNLDNLEYLINFSMFLKENELTNVFYSKKNLPSSVNYPNREIFRQFPYEFYNDYQNQRTSEATARYSALRDMGEIQFN